MFSKKVRTPSKTPRTLVGEFMDSSRTHTQKVLRDRFQGLVRTPEIPSVGRPPQHDRVASLQAKKTASSFSLGMEETPRQILEGFLADEHSTAPLVRVQRRTSQTGMSASQPALPVTRGWSHVSSPVNQTTELDKETPRTLMQKYLMNTSSTTETPVAIGGKKATTDSLRSTPVVPLVNDTYNTPSPFRESSGGSADVMPSTGHRGQTPRGRRGRFNLSAHDLGSSLVIPATNPNDYVVPSPFRSTSSDDSDEEVIVGTQPSRHVSRPAHSRRGFNLTVPEHVIDQLKQDRERQYEQEFDMESSPGDRQIDESELSDKHFSHYDYHTQSQHSHRMGTPGDRHDGESEASEEQLSHNDYQTQSQQSRQMEAEDELDNIHSVSSEEDRTREFTILPRDGIYREYTLPLKRDNEANEDLDNISHVTGSSARGSSHECRSVIYAENGQYIEQQSGVRMSQPGVRMSHGPYVDGSPQVGIISSRISSSPESGRSMQTRDPLKYGRYSEGHQSGLGAMSKGDTGNRRSEGHYREDMSMFSFHKGNESIDRHPGESNMSKSAAVSRSEASLQTANRSSESLMMSDRKDRSLIARSSHAGVRESLYLKAEGRNNSMHGITQRTFLGHEKTPESSHVLLAERRSHHTPDQAAEEEMEGDENSPIPAVTPSPVVSSRGQSPANVTPSHSQRSDGSPSRSYERSLNTRSGSLASLSVRSESSSRTPGKRTPLQSISPSGANTVNMNNIPNRSSVISNRASPGNQRLSLQGQSSSPLTLGSRSQTPAQRGTPKSMMSAVASSLRSRDVTPRTPLASPVVAGRKHGTVEQLPQQTMLFSPQIASTQNIAALPQPSTSQPHAEQEDLSDEEVVTPEQSSPSQPSAAAVPGDKSQAGPKKKVVRKPREKSRYLIPVATVKKQFAHYAAMRVSKEAIEEVMKISETYWDNLCDDLEAYAKHAGRKRIQMVDFDLLFRRQGYVTDRISLNSLIRRYLPGEEVEKLIPVVRANNRIEPPL